MSLTDEYDPGGHDVYGGCPKEAMHRDGVPKEVICRGGGAPKGHVKRRGVPQGAICGGGGCPRGKNKHTEPHLV